LFFKRFVTNLLNKSTATSNPNEIIDERFLSNELTAVCIDMAKKALNRIQMLSDLNSQPKMIEEISDLVIQTLVKDHFQYAIDIHTHSLQSIDFKQELNIKLFETIKILNNLMYLYDRFINTNVLQLLNGTVNYTNVLSKQKHYMIDLETKIDLAIDRALILIANHLKFTLQNEQKPSDFKVDESSFADLRSLSNSVCTPTCSKVLRIIQTQLDHINECFDGKNLNCILKEFGIKYHRCVYEHIIKFEYNELGAVTLIRDLNEYRQFSKNFNSPLLETLFVTLYNLANLLVVVPSNLQEVCVGESLALLNKDIIETFVKLRSDYKNIKFQVNRLNRV
jgi:exocyst complex component 5